MQFFNFVMSQYYFFTFLPPVLMIIWAVVAKVRIKDWANVFFLIIAGFTLLVNAFSVYHMLRDSVVPTWILLSQLILSPTIVPQAYLYFCRQMGTKGSVGVKIALWTLLALLLVPSISIDIHPFTEKSMCEPLALWHFNIFNHGARIYSISIPSVIILVQALITFIRVPVVVKALRVYDLRFSNTGKFFVSWWILAILFCVATSIIELDMLREPTNAWIYFVSYAVLVSFIFGMIALGMDLHPVQTSDEEDVDGFDDFISANKDLAERARRLFMEEKLYLRPGIVTDDVVSMLGTNRTYFTRMMRSEFNMSFNEFVTSERIAYSKQLLSGTDKTMEDIAMESGFSNASAYCRVFKRLTSTSPDAWRKEHHSVNVEDN